MKLIHWYGNSAIKRHLNAVPLDEFSTIMILADESRENDMMHSDSHSLSSLLLIRDLQKLKLNSVQNKDASKENPQTSCDAAGLILISAPVIRPASITTRPIFVLNDVI